MQNELIKIHRELAAFFETYKAELTDIGVRDEVAGSVDELSNALHAINTAYEELHSNSTRATYKDYWQEECATTDRSN